MIALDSFYSNMAANRHPYPFDPSPTHVAEKVLRRVEIAKVARNLQDCLAFASFKAHNGWQNRTLRSIEPEVTEKLKRKRASSNEDRMSDSASNGSDERLPRPSFSSTQSRTQKLLNSNRGRYTESVVRDSFHPSQFQNPRKRLRPSSSGGQEVTMSHTMSWSQGRLSQSSPMLQRQHSSAGPACASETAVIPESDHDSSPIFNIHTASEDDEDDIPMHSFNHPQSSSILSSSPPRTPPPARRTRAPNAKQGGADLLLHFAYSPSRSPAMNIARASDSAHEPPSTPPSQHTHLPSSVMNTPGTSLGLFNGALQTPGQNFNFADFVNVTPSPAQAPWGGRTPGAAKTPGAARLAKRGLNFDHLVPPMSSPVMQRKAPASHGLALQLGGELMPRS